jgi:single-strand DNA-binding protein
MSSRSLNKVLLIGNLTRDPELRYTPQGTPVCTFGLATNRSWQPAAGERQEETEFHRIVAWNKLAELCASLLFKGRKVYVEGRLQTRSWTDSQGQERTTVEIVIENMIVLDSKRKEGAVEGEAEFIPEAADSPAAPVPAPPATPSDTPTSEKKAAGQKAPAAATVNPDDIPF